MEKYGSESYGSDKNPQDIESQAIITEIEYWQSSTAGMRLNELYKF